MAERIPIEQVLHDIHYNEIGWIQDAAMHYLRTEYLGEELIKNPSRKSWQIWKPRYVYVKRSDRDDYEID